MVLVITKSTRSGFLFILFLQAHTSCYLGTVTIKHQFNFNIFKTNPRVSQESQKNALIFSIIATIIALFCLIRKVHFIENSVIIARILTIGFPCYLLFGVF